MFGDQTPKRDQEARRGVEGSASRYNVREALREGQNPILS